MKLNLKLGEKPGDNGMSMTRGPGEKEQEVYYPEFTFREMEEPEFPDEGTMTIRYRKVRTSLDKKAKKPYQCTLEVKEIVSADGESDDRPARNARESEDALDKLAAEKSKSKKNNPGNDDYDY